MIEEPDENCDAPIMLPCPFCGWEKIRIIENEITDENALMFGSKYNYCWCKVCGTRGPSAYSIGDTMHDDVKACIDRWNERGGVKS